MADRIKQMQKLIDRKIKEIESYGGIKKKKKPEEEMLPKRNGLLARDTQASEMQDEEEEQMRDAEEVVAEYVMNIRKFREEALNAKDKQK